MNRKIVSAFLLLVCFSLLAILSGAIPVQTRAEADPSAESTPSGEPAETESPGVNHAEATDAPVPTETPEIDDPPAPRRVETTIVSDSLLDNHTYYDIDVEEYLAARADISLPGEGYQVLILHTHTTEAYTPTEDSEYDETDEYRTTDPGYSVVRVGTELAEALSAFGLNVLHDTELHDYPSYTGSYDRSGAAIEAYLDTYPGIGLVIDLHRDALGDDDILYKTVADLPGMEAAQLMFVMGSDVNLENPGWRENLRLALTLQAAVDAQYPTLMRPVVLCDYRYNQQLSPGCLLLEVGTSGNTLEEALTAVNLFARAAGPVIAGWVHD